MPSAHGRETSQTPPNQDRTLTQEDLDALRVAFQAFLDSFTTAFQPYVDLFQEMADRLNPPTQEGYALVDGHHSLERRVPFPSVPVPAVVSSPECRQGKHAVPGKVGGCLGETWDELQDQVAPCPCDCHYSRTVRVLPRTDRPLP